MLNDETLKFLMISNRALLHTIFYGGVAVIGAGFWAKGKIQDRIKNEEYYKNALSQLRSNKAAQLIFGEPILDGHLDLGDSEHNHCDGFKAQFHVPVRGPKSSGVLHFWATRNSPQESWQLKRSEVEFKNDASKRLIIVRENSKQTN